MDENNEDIATIEIKARDYLHSGDLRKYVKGGNVKILITTGDISKPGKVLLDEAGIKYYPNVDLEIIEEMEFEGESKE